MSFLLNLFIICVSVVVCSSCSNSLKIGGLKYRTTGRQYVDDLGHVVMIERRGKNHVRAIAPMQLDLGTFQANSKQVYQASSFGAGGTVNLKSVTLGELGTSGNVGPEDGEDYNYYSEKKGSYVVFFCSNLYKITDEINSSKNYALRKRLYESQTTKGTAIYNRALGIITHAVKVFDHEELVKLGVAGTAKGGPKVTELLGGTEADGSFKIKSTKTTRLENGSVAAYLSSRLYFVADAPNNSYQIAMPATVDYVGTDSNVFLRPFYWLRN